MTPRHHPSRSWVQRARSRWLCAVAFGLCGCRDLKADNGFCANCPAGGDQTRDAQAVTSIEPPAADGGGGSAGIPSSIGTGSAGMLVAAQSGSGGSFSQPSDAGVPIGTAGMNALGAGTSALDAQVPLAGRAGIAGSHAAGSGGSISGAGGHGGCTPACPAAQPVCDPVRQICVECVEGETSACPSDAPACDLIKHTCVPCADGQTSGCGPKTPVCDTMQNKCVACTADQPGACRGDTPACDVADNTCAQCSDTNRQACSGTTRICDPDKYKCVECTTSNDCSEADRARCDLGTETCALCTADSDCTHLLNAPACDRTSGKCVACTKETEASTCPGSTCLISTQTCDTRPRNSVQRCMPCQADAECQPSDGCFQTTSGGNGGSFCFPRGATPVPGYSHMISNTASIDGQVSNYWMPIVSCQTLLAAGQACDMMSANRCGDLAANDGRCDQNACTFGCMSPADCPAPLTCSVNRVCARTNN